jgi:hypothetical protein
MSWASKRQTTKIEDIAYCLLGVFDIQMPLQYGEGGKAFIRLQEMIAHETNDLGLLAWTAAPEDGNSALNQAQLHQLSGILATKPAEFARGINLSRRHDRLHDPEFSMTNRGLKMRTQLFRSQP